MLKSVLLHHVIFPACYRDASIDLVCYAVDLVHNEAALITKK